MTRILTLVFLCTLLSSCYVLDCLDSNRDRAGLAEFSQRKNQWLEKQISHYELTYYTDCFCDNSIKIITVDQGIITSITAKSQDGTFSEVVPVSAFQNHFTVLGLFDLIASKNNTADKLFVEYDTTFGYPTRIEIDNQATRCTCGGGCSNAIDDEVTYHVSVK